MRRTFDEFKDDMYESYLRHINKFGSRNTSIERINNNGNYYKENCKWATWKEQARNRYKNNIITYNDKIKTISEWAEILGFHKSVLYYRVKKWGIQKAFTKPLCIEKSH